MPFTPLRALNGTQSMTSPGDIVCLMMGAYFGIIAWAHFFNSKQSKPYYTGAELSARWRVADKDSDT